MSMTEHQQQLAACAEAYDKARHHLGRASGILKGMGEAGNAGVQAAPEVVATLLGTALAEATTGQGWALLASAPRPPVMRGGDSRVDGNPQIRWEKP